MQIYSTDQEDSDFYVIRVSAVLDNLALLENIGGLFTVTIDPENPPSNLIYTASFEITIEMIDPTDSSVLSANSNPFFIPEPTDLYAYIGEEFEFSFGEAMDYEGKDGQKVKVQVDLGEAATFAQFISETNSIHIDYGVTDEFSVEVSQIVLTLIDDYTDEFLNENPGIT